MLCAVVNRYFGDWERLVIIERLYRGGQVDTAFIAVAITSGGIKAVTNFGPEGPGGDIWKATLRLRTFHVDRTKFEACLAELDKAHRDTGWRPFLWYGGRDWPVYFLHDIRLNQDDRWSPLDFACGITGWAMLPEKRLAPLQRAPRDYAKAEQAFKKYQVWHAYDEGTEAGEELRKAGAPYASLINLVWESTLGQPEVTILGVPPPVRLER